MSLRLNLAMYFGESATIISDLAGMSVVLTKMKERSDELKAQSFKIQKLKILNSAVTRRPRGSRTAFPRS
jgi:hypothetical protein